MTKRSNSTQNTRSPQAYQLFEQLKLEVAQELGIELPIDGYYGKMKTKDLGAIGGNLTRRLLQIAEETIAGRM
ncbi:hypothetical protein JOD82_002076 [Paenibacillus sp. 1182]|uniref:alpha/beta-type small acid-soluble spore protein n=1 Tax=Paenibacillus sp. 1182 TaxID=2806565 RepID=UPI001AE49D1D|nr:alpha/beta-type small acid-soluble spore protein [Paenibacillus sp. 1182]MBP1309056.1 hypothetical protein [Paenibacillus sp. 1182]